jgi:hypothetical protein
MTTTSEFTAAGRSARAELSAKLILLLVIGVINIK